MMRVANNSSLRILVKELAKREKKDIDAVLALLNNSSADQLRLLLSKNSDTEGDKESKEIDFSRVAISNWLLDRLESGTRVYNMTPQTAEVLREVAISIYHQEIFITDKVELTNDNLPGPNLGSWVSTFFMKRTTK